MDYPASSGAWEDGEQPEDDLVGGDGERRDSERIARLKVQVQMRRVAGSRLGVGEQPLGRQRVGESGAFCRADRSAARSGKREQVLTSTFVLTDPNGLEDVAQVALSRQI